MGEIGRPRNEFLYELRFWEVRRIVRGYRRRDRLKHQLIAECVYAATYSNRDPQGKTVEEIFPSLFDDDEEPITEEEAEDLTNMIESLNSANT